MRNMPSDSRERSIGLATAIGLTFLMLLKTAVVINNSYLYGRLAMPPVYDDVAYFNDALARVNVFRLEGLRAVIAGLITSPPHAPYSTLAAFVGFGISGGHRAAPYVMNAVAVAALTMFWLFMFRAGTISAWMITIMITATGWFDNTVTIYHPDLIAGYGIAIIASFALFHHLVLDTYPRRLAVGIAAGFVLLIKPTALGMALILWGVAFSAGLLASRSKEVTLLKSLRRYVAPILLMIIISAPYFAKVLPGMLATYYNSYVSERSTWIRLSGGANPWTFYLHRTYDVFSEWLYLFAALFVIVAITVMRRRRVLLVSAGGLFLCLVTAYIVPSLSYLQVFVFGGVVYGVVLIIGFISICGFTVFAPRLTPRVSPNPRTLSATVLLFIIVSVGATFEMKDGQARFPPDLIRKSSVQYERVYAVLKEAAVRSSMEMNSPHRILAYFPTVGVATDAYAFHARQDGLDILIEHSFMDTDSDRVVNSAHKADIVVIPDERLRATFFPYPVNGILDNVVQRLRKDPKIIETAPVELSDGAMLIFRQRPTPLS